MVVIMQQQQVGRETMTDVGIWQQMRLVLSRFLNCKSVDTVIADREH